jgi:FkbM family methyltransferase
VFADVGPDTLTTLARVPIDVEVAGEAPTAFRRGTSFSLPVVLRNRGARMVAWSSDHPLHLAYRWLDAEGKMLEREGLRSVIPGPLPAGEDVKVELAGGTPGDAGSYGLLVSLVLEGVHWACDVGAAGWTEVPVEVVEGPAWPAELRGSVGGRALRGALAAAELSRDLAGRTFDVLPPPEPAPVPAASPVAAPGPQPLAVSPRARRSVPARFRSWLRKVLGVRNVQNDLEAVANAVTRQEQRSTDLQLHLQAIEQQMHAHFERSQAQAHDLLEELAASRSQLVEQTGAFQSLRGGQARLLGRLEELSTEIANAAFDPVSLAGLEGGLEAVQASQRSLSDELRGGSVVTEIISTLRDLADLVQASNSTASTQQLEQGLAEVLRHLGEEGRNRASDRDAIVVGTTQNAVKLDALLTRQVVPLPSSGLVLVRNRFGLLAIQDEDTSAVAYYASGDVPEPGTVALVERLLQPGDSFLDVGANVGIYSLIAARRVGPDGRVIAVEPMPSSARALRTTLAVNGVSAIVQAHECALGAADGTATIHAGATSGHSSLLGPLVDRGESFEIAVRRGDDLLGEVRPTLIKIDVEGWELEVLDGLRGFLGKHRNTSVLLELSPAHVRRTGLEPSEWLARVKAFGWKCWKVNDQDLKLRPLTSADEIDDRGANLFVSRKLPELLETML